MMLAGIADLEAALGRDVEENEIAKAWRELEWASGLALRLAPYFAVPWETEVPTDAKLAVAGLASRRFNSRSDGLVAIGPFRYRETKNLETFTSDELIMLGFDPETSDTLDLAGSDE